MSGWLKHHVVNYRYFQKCGISEIRYNQSAFTSSDVEVVVKFKETKVLFSICTRFQNIVFS